MPSIRLYSRNGCQPCRAVKRFLNDRDITYSDTNVDMISEFEADEVRAMLAEDGYLAAPVVYVDNGGNSFHFHGYNPYELSRLEEVILAA